MVVCWHCEITLSANRRLFPVLSLFFIRVLADLSSPPSHRDSQNAVPVLLGRALGVELARVLRPTVASRDEDEDEKKGR